MSRALDFVSCVSSLLLPVGLAGRCGRRVGCGGDKATGFREFRLVVGQEFCEVLARHDLIAPTHRCRLRASGACNRTNSCQALAPDRRFIAAMNAEQDFPSSVGQTRR
jgi:hypothetical protein